MTTMNKTYIASAPSNIALIKYWGKKDTAKQIPANESISMTLDKCRSISACSKSSTNEDSFILNGFKIETNHKIYSFIKHVKKTLDIDDHLLIKSKNTFPLGCGIASSASGYAALTLAIAAYALDEDDITNLDQKGWNLKKLSNLARMGSGSACRSLLPGFVHWKLQDSTQSVEVQNSELDLVDIIVIVDSQEKEISSSLGHQSAWTSPLFKTRLAGIDKKMKHIKHGLEHNQFDKIGEIAENDALEMHSVMMSQTPACNYILDDTQKLMVWTRTKLREQLGIQAYFTLDAGPNLHILTESINKDAVINQLKIDFPEFKNIIVDKKGSGPDLKKQNIHIDDLDIFNKPEEDN